MTKKRPTIRLATNPYNTAMSTDVHSPNDIYIDKFNEEMVPKLLLSKSDDTVESILPNVLEHEMLHQTLNRRGHRQAAQDLDILPVFYFIEKGLRAK